MAFPVGQLDDEIDFDDTPQGEETACLKLEIERLNKCYCERTDCAKFNSVQ